MAADDPARRELTEQILGAEQDERRRIALFLHDGPVQSLSGVALMLDAALDLIERDRADQAIEVLEKALGADADDGRRAARPLVQPRAGRAPRPGPRDGDDALAEDRGMEHGVRVEIDVAAAEVLGERSQAALYEIVREAFEGAIRRGPPTLFSVHAAAGGAGLGRGDDPRRRAERAPPPLDRGAGGAGADARRRPLRRLRRRRHDDAARNCPTYAAPTRVPRGMARAATCSSSGSRAATSSRSATETHPGRRRGRARRRDAARDEDRTVAAPGRPPAVAPTSSNLTS